MDTGKADPELALEFGHLVCGTDLEMAVGSADLAAAVMLANRPDSGLVRGLSPICAIFGAVS